VSINVRGVIHGRRIELESEPGLPPGVPVLVRIEPQLLSLEEKRQLLDDLCGAWARDPTIEPIFAEIEQERRQATPREVSFDDPS
jgi:hypothetical protein